MEQYEANAALAEEKSAEAGALFDEALALPWWMWWKTAALFDRAGVLRHEAVTLLEDNVALAFEMKAGQR